VLVGLVALTGTLASASAGPIEWDAPAPPCPTVTEVEDAVRRMAGRMPDASEIRARAQVSRAGERWSLRLTTEVGERVQERALEADTCEALAKATAIVIAVAVDPIGAAHEVRNAQRIEAPSPERPPASAAATETAAETEVAPSPRATVTTNRKVRAPVRVHFGAGGGVVIGVLPGVSGGPVAALGLTAGRFRAELRGAWWAPRLGRDGGVTARIQVGTVGFMACGEPGPTRATFPICAGIESGAMRARGVAVTNPRTQHLAWAAALIGAGVRGWVRPRIGLRADVEVAIPFTVDRVVVGSPEANPPRTVHQTPFVGARALLGVEFRLP
jgi:hypothetical protein